MSSLPRSRQQFVPAGYALGKFHPGDYQIFPLPRGVPGVGRVEIPEGYELIDERGEPKLVWVGKRYQPMEEGGAGEESTLVRGGETATPGRVSWSNLVGKIMDKYPELGSAGEALGKLLSQKELRITTFANLFCLKTGVPIADLPTTGTPGEQWTQRRACLWLAQVAWSIDPRLQERLPESQNDCGLALHRAFVHCNAILSGDKSEQEVISQLEGNGDEEKEESAGAVVEGMPEKQVHEMPKGRS